MKGVFKSIMKLTVKHSYFEKEYCTVLNFIPDGKTKAIFDKYGFRMRELPNGFELYSSGYAQFDYINKVSGQDNFTFQIITRSPLFYIYTDLPKEWVGCILYDSATINTTTKTFIPNYSHTSDSPLLGEIIIRFSDLSEESNTTFQIYFDARLTRWVYYVMDRGELALQNPAIDTKGEIEFSEPNNVEIASGESALQFISNELIPLNENPDDSFDLIDKTVSGKLQTTKTKMILRGLPFAVPSGTSIQENQGEAEYASSIYVYV